MWAARRSRSCGWNLRTLMSRRRDWWYDDTPPPYVGIEHERVRDRDPGVAGVARVDDVEFGDHLPLVVAEEGEVGAPLLPGRARGRRIVRPDHHEPAVIDVQFRLQLRHVVRQLANILRSVASSGEDHHRGKPAHQAGELRQLLVVVGKLDIRECLARPQILSHRRPPTLPLHFGGLAVSYSRCSRHASKS